MNSISDLLRHGWEIHPSVVAGCVALLVWYFIALRPGARQAVAFLLGTLVLCLSLISPIDPVGDQYLFCAHMLQHLLLVLVVPPLLILGLAPARVASWMTRTALRWTEHLLGMPAIAWASNMFVMVIWHVPLLYNAANASTPIHVFEHMTFLVTGCMFWWPIVSPLETQRVQPARAMLYLFGAAVVSTVLGIVITFLPAGYYQPYAHPQDELGALHLIRDTWGISAAEDQKLAGLLMWVPGCTIYFLAILLELGRWFRTPDPDKQALLASVRFGQTEVRHG